MALTIPNTSPIYFPNLQSRFTGVINEEVNGDAKLVGGVMTYYWNKFCQIWAETDEIFFQVRETDNTPTYTVRLTEYSQGNEQSVTISGMQFLVGFSSTDVVWNFNIPLNGFSGEFTLTLVKDGIDLDTSVRMKILPADCDELTRSRLIRYAHLGCGRDQAYFAGTDNAPTYSFILRIPGVLQFDSRVSELSSSLGSNGVWDFSASRSYVVENFESLALPEYLHRLMSLVLLHRYLLIDGTRFLVHSDWRANTAEDGVVVREGSGQVKLYSSYE